MKRFLALTLALVLALSLAACSGSSVQGAMQDSSSSSTAQDNTPADSTPADNTPADSTPAESTPAVSAPSSGSVIGRPDGDEDWPHIDDPTYFEGRMGDTMRNVFFAYTVNSVDFPESYEGITASDGNQLLLANVTVKNVWGDNLPMAIYDFQIQWYDGDGSDGDDNYGYQDENISGGKLMPEYWELKRAQTVTYDILYEVPANSTEFSISYLEMWDNDTSSDVFFVYFEK